MGRTTPVAGPPRPQPDDLTDGGAIEPETITLRASNGEPLVVRRWTPTPETDRDLAVLVPSAMATPSRFYTAFAAWLAAHGCRTYAFDYQGYGASATGPLSSVRADFLTWADDARVVAAWAKQDAGDRDLVWLAHSLGGQLLAFAQDEQGHPLPDRAVLVAVGTGHWRLAEGSHRVLAPLLWYAIAPLTTAVLGYYPGQKLGILGDLPAPVMRQWARWCRNREHLWGVLPEHLETFARVDIDIDVVSFSDDETMSPAATAHLVEHYSGARVRSWRHTPAELGRDRIGHMGFFSPKNRELWERVVLPLLDARDTTS